MSTPLIFAIIIAAVIIGLTVITKYHLMGRDLSKYDREIPLTFETDYNSHGQQDVRRLLREMAASVAEGPKGRAEKLAAGRARLDQVGLDRDFDAKFVDDVVKFDGVQVPGQWTLVEGHDPDRRVLYLHGGGFTVGSPLSHRALTYNIAKRTGCAVFAIDYRLMPENPHLACVEDSCASYKWILENGPNGPAPVKSLAVAGDSAGGNLALVVSNFARDEDIQRPEAIVAFSPGTDSTFVSPTIRTNFETDLMLGPFLEPILKVPQAILLWASWFTAKVSPSSPLASPVRADLSGLPPTLVQASTSEMLYGDSVRYVNKAQDAGSPVALQSWDHLCHIWPIFDELLPEATHALDEVAKFMKENGAAV